MANATALKKTVKKTVEEQVDDGVILMLSKDEAETLRLIVCNIGGDRYESRRKHAEAIAEALRLAGVYKLSAYSVNGVLQFPYTGPSKAGFDFLTNANPYTPNPFIR